MRKLVFALVAVLGLMVVVPAQAQFKAGDLTLSISGSGSNSPDFNGTAFQVNAELGKFLTDSVQVSIRQGVGFDDRGGSDNTLFGSTAFAADYHFNLGKFQPFVGAEIGYVYGAGYDHWVLAPEAGLKYFVNSTTFVYGKVQYQLDLNQGLSDGDFAYSLGLGFKF